MSDDKDSTSPREREPEPHDPLLETLQRHLAEAQRRYFCERENMCPRRTGVALAQPRNPALPRWKRDSLCGTGPRVPQDRDARARFKFLAKMHRGAGRLSATGLDVAEALERLLVGPGGRLDPSYAFLAAATGASVRTVGRQLARLRDLGLLWWQRRLERSSSGAWRCEQTSNAYVLAPAAAGVPCEGHSVRPVRIGPIKKEARERQQAPPAPSAADLRALEVVCRRRMAALGVA